MEKIRPIDQKLKYQIDKLVKIATTGRIGKEHTLHDFISLHCSLVLHIKLHDNFILNYALCY